MGSINFTPARILRFTYPASGVRLVSLNLRLSSEIQRENWPSLSSDCTMTLVRADAQELWMVWASTRNMINRSFRLRRARLIILWPPLCPSSDLINLASVVHWISSMIDWLLCTGIPASTETNAPLSVCHLTTFPLLRIELQQCCDPSQHFHFERLFLKIDIIVWNSYRTQHKLVKLPMLGSMGLIESLLAKYYHRLIVVMDTIRSTVTWQFLSMNRLYSRGTRIDTSGHGNDSKFNERYIHVHVQLYQGSQGRVSRIGYAQKWESEGWWVV